MGYMTEFHFQCDCTDEKRMEQIVQKIIISAFGEINDDIWEAHYLDGKRQLCEAEIRIPEFNPEKLA